MMGIGAALLVPALQRPQPAARIDPVARLSQRLDTALRHFWLPEASRVTLGASNLLNGITDVVSGGINMGRTAGTATWHASGGPGGAPYVSLDTTDALVRADGLGYADGHTISLYVVARFSDPDKLAFIGRTAANTTSYQLSPVDPGSGHQWRTVAFYSDGSFDEAYDASTPIDAGWHLFHLRALVGGGTRGYIDGRLLSPNGVAVKPAKDLAGVHWGYVVAGASAGDCAMAMLVDAVDADRDDAVKQFVAAYYGTGITLVP